MIEQLEPIRGLLAGVFGLLIGSFLNVCVYRLPNDLSVVKPRSYCPHCETPIAWYDNIPVVSYFLLRGACRHCRKPILFRYVLVELLTGLLFFSIVQVLGLTLLAGKYLLMSALLVGLAFSDLEERILPDEFTLGGTLAGLVFAWFVPMDRDVMSIALMVFDVHWDPRLISVVESMVGALVPSGLLWTCGWVYEKVRHREGLGFGDVKMLMMIGAFLGTRGTVLTLLIASILGTVVGLAYILISRKDMSTYELPLGTYMALAALIGVLMGQNILSWYAGLL